MVRVEIRGVKEVVKELGAIDRSLKAKLGIIASKGADLLVKEAKNQLIGFDAIDSGQLEESIDKEKIEPYVWKVSDKNYPAGVIPYGIFVELGFMRHIIHRSQVNPFSRKLNWFIDSEKRFMWVGPMPPRPFMQMATNATFPRIQEMVRQKLDEALRLK
jgi:hypothetical protein